MSTLLTVLHVIVCLFLMLTVLLQSGKGGGMGGAFGGGNAATVFGGSGASTFLRKLTAGAATIFMATSMILAFLSSHNSADSLEKFGENQSKLAAEKEAAKAKALKEGAGSGSGSMLTPIDLGSNGSAATGSAATGSASTGSAGSAAAGSAGSGTAEKPASMGEPTPVEKPAAGSAAAPVETPLPPPATGSAATKPAEPAATKPAAPQARQARHARTGEARREQACGDAGGRQRDSLDSVVSDDASPDPR
ncbi:MAG: preprotein translocase subunit SecG [Myxococcales bacterium]|nr:preprotein translocase subunit SecG [Myxococcales bacterium]